jgi:SAM-dependent methyltransferase
MSGDAAEHPDATHLATLTDRVKHIWPAHSAFIVRNLAARTPEEIAFLDDIARRILILTGGALDAAILSYKNTCAQYMKAEMLFRKQQHYANQRFDEVVAGLYDKQGEMHSYMTGLLLSVALWWQNSGPYFYFQKKFLPMFDGSFQLIEIGPGHGLGTSMALERPGCTRVVGLDISAESLEMTRRCLRLFGVEDRFVGRKLDICEAAPEGPADGVVVSQVLEIVSDPGLALANVHAALRPGGLLYLNAPVDFAAPDHIRRWRDSDQIDAILTRLGFEIHDRVVYRPSTVEESRDAGFSYVVVCAKSGSR